VNYKNIPLVLVITLLLITPLTTNCCFKRIMSRLTPVPEQLSKKITNFFLKYSPETQDRLELYGRNYTEEIRERDYILIKSLAKKLNVDSPEDIYINYGPLYGASTNKRKQIIIGSADMSYLLIQGLIKDEQLTFESQYSKKDLIKMIYEFIISHELTHIKEYDTQKVVISKAIITPALTSLTAIACYKMSNLHSVPGSLLCIGLCYPLWQIMTKFYNRRQEKRADTYACSTLSAEHTKAAIVYFSLLDFLVPPKEQNIFKQTLSHLTRIHPSNEQRIRYLRKLLKKQTRYQKKTTDQWVIDIKIEKKDGTFREKKIMV